MSGCGFGFQSYSRSDCLHSECCDVDSSLSTGGPGGGVPEETGGGVGGVARHVMSASWYGDSETKARRSAAGGCGQQVGVVTYNSGC